MSDMGLVANLRRNNLEPPMSESGPKATVADQNAVRRFVPILLQKSKITR